MTSRDWMHKVPAAVLSATILVFGGIVPRNTKSGTHRMPLPCFKMVVSRPPRSSSPP